MSGPCVVGSDLGSGGCKTIVMDAQGRVLGAAQQEYPTAYPQPGWVEQAADDWYAAFCATTRAALGEAGVAPQRIAGVGIVGVTHNTVLLDERDRPLCPSILIFDTRSTAQVEAIYARWGSAVRECTLNEVTPTWSWPQLRWLRENRPEAWRATRRILFQKDYVRHRLAPAAVTDVIDAGGSLLFDPVREAWIEPFYADLGLDPAWLPRTVAPMEVVARVSRQGAADSGLPEGAPVIAGTTDTLAEMVGSGANRPGAAIVKLASVGRIAAAAGAPVPSARIFSYRHIFPGLWYPGTAAKCAATAYRWLRDLAWRDAPAESAYGLMDEAAAQVPAGCEGLLFQPHLTGAWAPYWDAAMRGSFAGLTARHTRAHLTRAVLEGVAFSLKDALAEMEGLGVVAADIRLIGQGARSELWGRIVADVLERPLRVVAQPDAAYGAALITAMGVGAIGQSPEALDQAIAVRRHIEPDPVRTRAYAALFDIYREANQAMRSVSARLHDFEHGAWSGSAGC